MSKSVHEDDLHYQQLFFDTSKDILTVVPIHPVLQRECVIG